MKTFVIDVSICNGCYNCQIACKDEHVGNDWKEPRCVDACPTEAIKFGEESKLKSLISQAEVLNPEFKTMPRVHYLKIPRKFVAGTVYDPVAKEVIIGATCTLADSKSGKKATATTDGFYNAHWLNIRYTHS